MMKKNKQKEQPNNLVFEKRLNNVRVSIWENSDKDGNAFHNVTIVRRYMSAPDEWSNSNSYTGLGDMALLSQAVKLAESFLMQASLPDRFRAASKNL